MAYSQKMQLKTASKALKRLSILPISFSLRDLFRRQSGARRVRRRRAVVRRAREDKNGGFRAGLLRRRNPPRAYWILFPCFSRVS